MTAFEVVTLFPELVQAFASTGIVGRAGREGAVEIHATNPRDFTQDRHRTVDDVPFGGGAGMVMKLEPVLAAIASLEAARGPTRRILLTPTGRPFTQRDAERLSACPRLTLLCGRYEGIDDRIRGDVDETISIGDFVLNGGEIAAMAIIEAISRLGEGVLHNPDSARDDSFTAVEGASIGPHLEHPHYTRPPEVQGRAVPKVLRAGDHSRVTEWRTRASLVRTWTVRPGLRPRWSLAEDTPICLWVGAGGEGLLDVAALGTVSALTEIVFEGPSGALDSTQAPIPPAADTPSPRAAPRRFSESLAALRRKRRRGGGGEPHVVVLRELATLAATATARAELDGGVDVGEGVDQPIAVHVAPLLDLLAFDVARAATAQKALHASPAGRATLHAPAGVILVVVPDPDATQSAAIAAPSFVEFAISPAAGHGGGEPASLNTPAAADGAGSECLAAGDVDTVPAQSAQHHQDSGTPAQGSPPDDLARADPDRSSLAFAARMIDASRPRWTGGFAPQAVSAAIASLVGALRRAGREPPPSEFTP